MRAATFSDRDRQIQAQTHTRYCRQVGDLHVEKAWYIYDETYTGAEHAHTQEKLPSEWRIIGVAGSEHMESIYIFCIIKNMRL